MKARDLQVGDIFELACGCRYIVKSADMFIAKDVAKLILKRISRAQNCDPRDWRRKAHIKSNHPYRQQSLYIRTDEDIMVDHFATAIHGMKAND